MKHPTVPAVLALADGSLFRGVSIGVEGAAVGEVVFNTAMSGYQEIVTDPSYRRQLVTLTYPHIGNVGTNPDDAESSGVQLGGLILREVPRAPSSWRNRMDFRTYLREQRVIGIAKIDTRRLTRILRDGGAQNGCILAGDLDETDALAQARAFEGLEGMDLAREVTCTQPYDWEFGSWRLDGPLAQPVGDGPRITVYDLGVKRSILRQLVDRGSRVRVVPARTPAAEVLRGGVDGVLLSNGPGDPEPCDYAITAAREFLSAGLPLFGICLGHQVLGLAAGARTLKMKFGHHGANHPVQDLETGQVLITSQNHGFAVDEDSLPENVATTHRSLFDGSLQGLRIRDVPAFGFQGHPEASPGPQDVTGLFDKFLEWVRATPGDPKIAKRTGSHAAAH